MEAAGFIKACLLLGLITRQKRCEVDSKDQASPIPVSPFVEAERTTRLTNEQKDALQLFEKQSPGSSLIKMRYRECFVFNFIINIFRN